MMPRSTITPMMPHTSARYWYFARDGEEAEDQADDEDVVDRQRLLDEEAGVVFHAQVGAALATQTQAPKAMAMAM